MRISDRDFETFVGASSKVMFRLPTESQALSTVQ